MLVCNICDEEVKELIDFEGEQMCKDCKVKLENEHWYTETTETLWTYVDSLELQARTFKDDIEYREHLLHEHTKEELVEEVKKDALELESELVETLEKYLEMRKKLGINKPLYLSTGTTTIDLNK